MSITGKIISPLLFLLLVSCAMKSDTTTRAIVYNINDNNYFFCINDSYYLPIRVEGIDLSDAWIKMMFPDVTTDTIFINTENISVHAKEDAVFFANNILCTTTSIICDAYIKGSLMCVKVYNKDGSARYTSHSLQSEELQIIDYLKDKLQRERQDVYLVPMDINESTCDYQYLILLDSDDGEKKFFVSGNNPNEPTPCAMLSDFIESLVLKHTTNIHPNNAECQHCSDSLRRIRCMLEKLEKDYHIVPEAPIEEGI